LAALHRAVLPDSPVARLGPQFAASIYYGALPAAGLLFGAYFVIDGLPIGMAVGTNDPAGFMSKGLKANLGPMVRLSPTLVHPRAAAAVVEAIRIRGTQRSTATRDVAVGQVLSVGVLPAHRGARGGAPSIARLLLDALIVQLADREVRRAYLLVEEDNETAKRFYTHADWRLTGEVVSSWRNPLRRMERELGPPLLP
jgi:ribosomal protein S18 acetylase RimI-like enzyme